MSAIKKRIILGVVGVWVLVTLFFSKNQLSSDGFLEIGFPIVFCRRYSGLYKPFYSLVGFSWKSFLLDMSMPIVLVLAIFYFVRKRKVGS